jgi:acyl-[acyl-carrier-protein]-phospholipid O-acyltransferase/long-chain-fatty-acid--[acyl-carrier-protein] ligase
MGMSKSQYQLLKTRRFLPLFITQFFNAFNDNAFKNALVILITYRITQNGSHEQFMIALIAGLFILPFFLFSAIAGQIADKFEKSKIIILIKSLEVIFMLVACVGFYLNSLFLLMITLFFLGIHSTFFGPIKYAILPEHLHKNELIGGNALIEAGTFAAILIGQILGGSFILKSYGDLLITFLLISVAILGLVSSFFIPKTAQGQPHLKISGNFIKETWKIIQIAREKRDIFLSILGISWFWFLGATFITQFPTFTKEILSSSMPIFTLFLTTFSLGIGLGSLICNKLLKGRITTKFVPIAILGISVFMFDTYLAAKNLPAHHSLMTLSEFMTYPIHIRILLDVLFMTICTGFFVVPLYALIQERSQEAVRSRVIAANNIMNALFMVGSTLYVISFTFLQFSLLQIFLMTAILNLLVAIYTCKLLPEAIVQSFLNWLLRLLYRVEVRGIENYHLAGNRLLIVANHTSFLDAPLLAAFIPHKLSFAINTQVAKEWWLAPISKIIDTISLDPTNPLAIKSLIKKIKENHQCVIFPEGRITVTGSLMKIYEGPGIVADQSKANILPVRIEGAEYTPFSYLKNKVNRRWFPKITLTILPPCDLRMEESIKGRERRQILGRKLYEIMSNMMFESSDYKKTLFQSLLEARKIHSGRHIILEDIKRKPINYNTLIKQSFVLSGYWQKAIPHHDRVAILLPNLTSTVIIFFGLLASGRTPVMLNYTFGINDMLFCCDLSQIKDIITSKQFLQNAKLDHFIPKLEAHKIRLHFIENIPTSLSFYTKLKGWLNFHAANFRYKPGLGKEKQPAVILFTSGSEGKPKGVVLSHENIQANRFQLSARIDFTAQDIIFNALPMFHSFGLSAGTLLPVLFGMKTFLYPSPLHYKIIPELIYDINATVTFGTDTFLAGYGRFANPYDFYSIRYVLAGAEKLKAKTQALWNEKFGIRILEGYGATETSPVLSMNTPMFYQKDSVGQPLPGIEYRLLAIDSLTEGGRLFVKGPNIMLGYLLADQPEIINPPPDNWYDTGDIVKINEKGYLSILGRAKRFAKIGGEMVSLVAIEQTIETCWPDYQHAIVVQFDAQKGEQLVLFTTFREASREMLLKQCKEKGIREIQTPKKIVHVEKMPILGTGKIDYATLKTFLIKGVNHATSTR